MMGKSTTLSHILRITAVAVLLTCLFGCGGGGGSFSRAGGTGGTGVRHLINGTLVAPVSGSDIAVEGSQVAILNSEDPLASSVTDTEGNFTLSFDPIASPNETILIEFSGVDPTSLEGLEYSSIVELPLEANTVSNITLKASLDQGVVEVVSFEVGDSSENDLTVSNSENSSDEEELSCRALRELKRTQGLTKEQAARLNECESSKDNSNGSNETDEPEEDREEEQPEEPGCRGEDDPECQEESDDPYPSGEAEGSEEENSFDGEADDDEENGFDGDGDGDDEGDRGDGRGDGGGRR